MERAKVIKDELVEQNIHFLSVYLETKNSCLILLSENEDRLGTLAIAIPKPPDTPGLPSSYVILGTRNVISARMFAEYLASKKGKIAIVSVYLERMDEMQAQAIFKRLIERVTLTEPKIEGFESREGGIT
ncbi:hypothetical protein KEJ37_00550 [Candidatus Bathyarchaeota archaeon]|nr:hypothetical protein [Candidatus Bathyarchaeota archaeon]